MDAPTQSPRNPFSPPPRTNGHSDRPVDSEPVNPARRAFHEVPIYLAELKSQAAYLLSAKVDAAKASVRRLVMFAVLGVVGILIAGGLLISAAFLTLSGLAMGLGHLLGGHPWLGNLIVGLLVIGGTCLVAWMGVKKLTGGWHLQTEQKYERKRNEQRGEFGRDVQQRAGQG